MRLTAGEIAAVTGGVLRGSSDLAVSSICTDSRKAAEKCLFVPWAGENFDGHDFIADALRSGAAGCLCSRDDIDVDINIGGADEKFLVRVPDTRLALKALAAHYRKQFSVPVIQITGSVSKTTTRDMIAAALGGKLRVWKSPENYNNDIGVPLTLLGLDSSHQAAVIETGMNHMGEIRYLGEMVRPDIAVITNIGDAHIEYLGSRENILRAKCEILDFLRPDGLLVLNGDDPLLNTIQLPSPRRVIRCGLSPNSQIRITDLADHGVEGITCTVTGTRDSYALRVPAPGDHMAYAAAIAAAICEELGLERNEIIRGIAAYVPTGSRMRVLRWRGCRVVLDDCYNANPQSVAAALEVLAKTECDRRVAVLGDMGELGELSDRAHYNMGALAVMLGVDFVIAVGGAASRIADGAEQNGGSALHFDTKEAALPELRAQFDPGTAMLIKASHAMDFGTLVEQLREFYD